MTGRESHPSFSGVRPGERTMQPSSKTSGFTSSRVPARTVFSERRSGPGMFAARSNGRFAVTSPPL